MQTNPFIKKLFFEQSELDQLTSDEMIAQLEERIVSYLDFLIREFNSAYRVSIENALRNYGIEQWRQAEADFLKFSTKCLEDVNFNIVTDISESHKALRQELENLQTSIKDVLPTLKQWIALDSFSTEQLLSIINSMVICFTENSNELEPAQIDVKAITECDFASYLRRLETIDIEICRILIKAIESFKYLQQYCIDNIEIIQDHLDKGARISVLIQSVEDYQKVLKTKLDERTTILYARLKDVIACRANALKLLDKKVKEIQAASLACQLDTERFKNLLTHISTNPLLNMGGQHGQ